MKKADLKTGVVYGYKTGKYDTLKPVVLVSLDLYRSNSDRWGRDKSGEAKYVKASPGVVRPSKGDVFAGEVGYLVISNQNLRWSSPPKNPLSLDALTEVTLEQVLAAHVHGKDLPEGYTVALVNNSHITGVYDDLVDAKRKATEATVAYYARQRAEAEVQVAAVQANHAAVVNLGIVVPEPHVEGKREWISDLNAYVDGGKARNVEQVVMQRAELDRLVVLVEYLRGVAVSTAPDDETREWIRLLTANDVVKPRVEV